MTPFLASQILAGLTLVTGMLAFQLRDRKWILRGWFLAALFAAMHFYLLGSVEACILVAITATRMLVSSFTTDARLMWLFLVLSAAGFALTYENPVSLIGLAATLIGTWGSFRHSEILIRYTMMATELLWATHNLIIWSPVGVGMEVLFFASNLTGLIRHRRARQTAL